MTSSYNRKSSSSASNAQKPTFRKPVKQGKGSTRRTDGARSSRPRASGSPSLARKGSGASGKTSIAPASRVSMARSGAASATGGRLRAPSAKPSSRAPRKQASQRNVPSARTPVQRQALRSGAGKAASFSVPSARSSRSSRAVAKPSRKAGSSAAPSFKLPSFNLPALRFPKRLGIVLAGVAGVAVLALIAFLVVANTSVFAATEIELVGTSHVSQESMANLVKVPEGTTLLNVDEEAIADQLKKDSWVKGVDIQREFPHKLVITPVEHTASAIVYISTADVAWAVSDEGTWIAPVSLGQVADDGADDTGDGGSADADGASAQDDADGEADDAGGSDDGSDNDSADSDAADDADSSDGADSSSGDDSAADDGTGDSTDGSDADAARDSESAQAGYDAALDVANEMGALLIADVGTDCEPKSGEKVAAEGVSAAIEYATGFSEEFRAQVKSFSAPSAESLSLYTVSGVEVSLGVAEDIPYKETVIERILSENPTVTYINVRTPESPTWRTVAS